MSEEVRKTLVATIGALVMLVLALGAALLSTEPDNVTPPTYREEPHILTDGTPCTIIHGGTHSGIVGITCNYRKKEN